MQLDYWIWTSLVMVYVRHMENQQHAAAMAGVVEQLNQHV